MSTPNQERITKVLGAQMAAFAARNFRTIYEATVQGEVWSVVTNEASMGAFRQKGLKGEQVDAKVTQMFAYYITPTLSNAETVDLERLRAWCGVTVPAMDCSRCDGEGCLTCQRCHREPNFKCGLCDGEFRVTCPTCKGTGSFGGGCHSGIFRNVQVNRNTLASLLELVDDEVCMVGDVPAYYDCCGRAIIFEGIGWRLALMPMRADGNDYDCFETSEAKAVQP